MKLWVDDIRNAPDDTWHVARTAIEAIRAIARFDFDEISIDHDISHQVQVGGLSRPYPCEETFASVAYYFAAKYKDTPYEERPSLTIHSSNVVAAKEMDDMIVEQTGYHAFLKPMGIANRLEMEV